MSIPIARAAFIATQASPRRLHAVAALAATLVLLAYHAAAGFPTLADSGGDNDSVLRLVQVRDLLAGQGWFDSHQYRMGVDGGFAMHWSRLVDAPIALLAMALGETAALIVWPLALFGLSVFLIVRMAYSLGGDWAVLPAAAVGGLALWFVNAYPPGALDHHNVQLTLALATVCFLMRGQDARPAALAGGTAALMLAVGMEAAPYVAVACAVPAVAFLLSGEREAAAARGFGAAFAGVALAALFATSAPGNWLSVQCDAHSLPQASLAVLGGGGLWLIASVPALRRSAAGRAAALAALGVVAAGIVVVAFPQCLAAPYSDLDPRVYDFLIENIIEAQSLFSILGSAPAMAPGYYMTPLIALGVLLFGMWRRGVSRPALVTAVFLAMAIAVGIWQVRGSVFAIAIAAAPLAAWIAGARRRVEGDTSAPAQLAMLGAWLVSFNLVWFHAPMMLFPAQAAPATAAQEEISACYAHADYAALAALPAGTVLAVSNQGSSILLNTPHRALNGPYHRNNAGNLAALDMLMGDPAEAEAEARRHGVGYVALCHGNDETAAIRAWAPQGLLARLADGDVPGWLAPVPAGEDAAIGIYRVVPR